MTQMKIEIRPIIIKVSGPLAVGTGFRRGLIHRIVERDVDGLVYIPASSFKGRVRRTCEQLAKQFGVNVCHAPRPEGMCSAHGRACLVCRVFGSPGRDGGLRWRDAHLTSEYRDAFKRNREAQVYSRTQVQLSRALGIAAPDHLFTSEYAIEELQFETIITGWLDVTPIAEESTKGGYEFLLLLAGLRLINTLGGQNSRGGGAVNVELPEIVKVNGVQIPWKDILDNLEWLELFDEEAGDD